MDISFQDPNELSSAPAKVQIQSLTASPEDFQLPFTLTAVAYYHKMPAIATTESKTTVRYLEPMVVDQRQVQFGRPTGED